LKFSSGGGKVSFLREDRGVRYELFDIFDLDDVAATIADVFSAYEPMAVTQNVSQGEMINLIKVQGSKAAQESLTIVAKSKEEGKVIGVLLCDDFAAVMPENISAASERLSPILALLDELDTQYKRGKSVHLNQYLHLSMLAVRPQHKGKKIAQNLVEISLKNGIKRGYQKTVAAATGTISQHIFKKFNFVDQIIIPYKTFVYEDVQVFGLLEGNIILLDKTLT
jgi:ribosomal protein S18 acetylase RimI-like enzyme